MTVSDLAVEAVVRAALAEDLGLAGDVTAAACIPEGLRMKAVVASRKPGVVAGVACAVAAFRLTDASTTVEVHLNDGDAVAAGQAILTVEGLARAVLAAERTALNLMSRLSGVATLTRRYVDAAAGTRARIADTRKTTPGLRALEKAAVKAGGGLNHRFGLFDAVLIKDNHLAVCGGVEAAVTRARAAVGHLVRIELEVDGLDQLDLALSLVDAGAGPDVVMLDNFTLADLSEAVARTRARVVLEASGGVTLETVGAIARTGVDVISVGALTHSAPILDLGLDALA